MSAGAGVWIKPHRKTSGEASTSFRVYYRLRPQAPLHGKVHPDLEAAERFAAAMRALVVSHKSTVSDAIGEWQKHMAQQAARGEMRATSAQQAAYRVRRLLHAVLALPLATLTEKRAREEYECLANEGGLAVGSQHECLQSAKTWGAWLVEAQQLRSNPFASIKKLGVRDDSRDVSLRITEARAFREKAIELADGGDVGALAGLIIISASLRPNEACKLRKRDVDDGGRVLQIDPPEQVKTRNTRRGMEILDEELRRLLVARAAELGAAGDRLIPRAPEWVTSQVRRVCELAGVPSVDCRALRRSYARIAATQGQSLQWIAAGMGHGNDATGRTARAHYIAPEALASGHAARVVALLTSGGGNNNDNGNDQPRRRARGSKGKPAAK